MDFAELAKRAAEENPAVASAPLWSTKGAKKGRIRKVIACEGKHDWMHSCHYDTRGSKLVITARKGESIRDFWLHGFEYKAIDATRKKKSHYWKIPVINLSAILEGLEQGAWLVNT